MTIDEAKSLNKGDYIIYNNLKYKVLHTKEQRSSHTNELYVNIKCSRQNETLWLSNKFAELTNYEVRV